MDAKVKSLLSRELRWFNTQKSIGKGIYPFSRATAFTQEFKKLDNGLDECRVIISEIGNTVALVRMIRAAMRRVFSNEMPFLSSTATSEGLQSQSSNVKSGVDDAISAILLGPDPDFVRSLVTVFKGVVTQKVQSDDSFFCIVPALCLCWMEASIQGKDAMQKKSITTRDSYYTDDGFAVGLQFVLSALNQTEAYER